MESDAQHLTKQRDNPTETWCETKFGVCSRAYWVQVAERDLVDQQAQLLAFDRQNHMGASDRQASNLQQAIAEEADAQMQEKRVVNSAVNIAENKTKMKVLAACS